MNITMTMKIKKTETNPELYSTVIYTFCAECKVYKGTKDGYGISGISHGLCEPCAEIQMKKIKKEFKNKVFGAVSAVVLVVTTTVAVVKSVILY